jgi:acetyl esterase/lipase
MQTAVRWFRVNAASLRIDPDRIAVGGTSAGAVTALGVAVNADAPLPGDHPDYSSAVCTAVSQFGANDPVAIGPNDAGAIFHHGTLDTIVPFAMAQETRDAMLAAGLDVQWPRLAVRTRAVPVEEPVGDVARLLNLRHEQPGADRMHVEHGDEQRIAANPRVAGRGLGDAVFGDDADVGGEEVDWGDRFMGHRDA